MRSILTVTAAAAIRELASLDRVKRELGISDTTEHDDLLEPKLLEASAAIEQYCRRVFARQTYSERFPPGCYSTILLRNWPVASISSVTVDGVAETLTADTTYVLDGELGQVSALCSGYPSSWYPCKSLAVVYVAGYRLPDESDRDLPRDIEGAVVALMRAFWRNKDRDPNLKARDIQDVGRFEWWVSDSAASSLPPEVQDMLEPYVMPAVGA